MKSISLSIVFVLAYSNGILSDVNNLDNYIQGIDNVKNLWCLKPAPDAVFDKTFVLLLNNFVTLERNKVVFCNEEVDLLTKECNIEDVSCTVNKAKSLTKINTKLQAIKCVNSVIVENLFLILYGFNSLAPYDIYTVVNYRKLVARMLSVMYAGKSYVPRWNLTIYIRLLGASEIISQDAKWFDNSELREGVKNYKNKCQKFGYIPSDENDLNVNTLIESLYNNGELTKLYQHAERFTKNNLILSPVYEYDYCLFAGQSSNFIDWTETRKLLDNAKQQLKVLYFNDKVNTLWMVMPLRRLAYHEAILKITYARILYYTWFHLTTYQYNVNKQQSGGTLEDNLKIYWNLLFDPLHEAVRFAAIDDCFFWNLLHTLKNTVKSQISDERLSELVSTSKALLQDYLKLLKVEKVESLLDIDRKYMTQNDMRNNVEDLSDFIKILKEAFGSLKTDVMFFIKFVVRAKNDITFFTQKKLYPCFSTCHNFY